MSSDSRDDVLDALIRESHRLGGRLALTHQGTAEALGLNVTDLLCLDMIGGEESLTAGRLADLLQLTTGAVTGVLDRLERAGFVRRERDPGDRRRVLVRLSPDRERDLAGVLDPLAGALAEVTSRYSDAEARLALDFVSRLASSLAEEAARTRSRQTQAEGRGGAVTLPFGGEAAARLEVDGGLMDVAIDGGPDVAELVRAAFGDMPSALARSGATVTVRPGRRSLLRRWTVSGHISLNGSVRWTVVVRAGMSKVAIDLRGVELGGFEVHGGVSRVDVSLPVPAGTVPVSVSGGASRLDVRRPPGTPLRIQLRGGAGRLKVDTFEFTGVGGPVHWQTPDFDAATDRYELIVSGGADRLTIGPATT